MVIQGGQIINLAGTTPIDDPEYRYKMPAVYGKVEGSGNGIKTAIPNISEVGSALHRDPGEVNKFFGCELGAQTRYNVDTDRAIVNGAHTDGTLQDLIRRYIDKFVLCPNCTLPETEYKIKNDTIWHKCAACGAKEMVDMQHKLCNYIINEDKKAKKEKAKNKGKNDKDDKKKKEKKKDKDSDDDKKKKDKKKDKKSSKKDKTEKNGQEENGNKDYIEKALLGEKNGHTIMGVDDDEDDAASLASEAGVDDQAALKLAIRGTAKYIAENPDASPAEIVEVATNQQMASALKSSDKVHILVGACITSNFFKNKEIATFAPAIGLVTNRNKIMERHLIAAVEGICLDMSKKYFPVMIKQLHDEDVLDEETILEWADEGRSEYTLASVDEEARAALRGEAEPVVVWLQEAEADSDDSSGDSGE